MKNKYSVTLYLDTEICIDVEATDVCDAVNQAYKELKEPWNTEELLQNMRERKNPKVEPLDWD